MSEDFVIEPQELSRWDPACLRTVRYEPTQTVVFARSKRMLQRSYEYETQTQDELSIRRVVGLPLKGSHSDLIWLKAMSEQSADIAVGVDSAYIFERTSCYITPKIIEWGRDDVVPMLDIVTATLNEIEDLLNLRVTGFLPAHDIPRKPPNDYLAVDHRRACKVVILSNPLTAQALEDYARHYCAHYWNLYDSMSRKVHFEMALYLYPSLMRWTSEQLANLGVGDLLSIQNLTGDTSTKTLRGFLKFRGNRLSKSKYEVFLVMTEDDTKLHFGSDELNQNDSLAYEQSLPPHEQIELEIHAGRTKILFNDLCSVQAGTLIELREHALPTVTLCVMGSPILEGELVHFQDQLMVQVTRRLD